MFDTGPAIDWLVRHPGHDLGALVAGLAVRLIEAGVPIWRLNASSPTMHPEVFVRNASWTAENGAVVNDRPYALMQQSFFLDSPVAAVRAGRGPIRRRLEDPSIVQDFPICRDLQASGATDYLCDNVPFVDGQSTTYSVATRAPGGFSDAHFEAIRSVLPALALRLELIASHIATRGLLQVYLGPNAARRVLAGEFTRGSGTSLRAAIWTSDVRGFTALSDGTPPAEVTRLLDQHFERVVAAVAAEGGEVLKFIGDAVLAVFPAEDDAASACGRALRAARAALLAMDAWNEGRERRLDVGIALHFGEVFYGNIGGSDRLDFTVIGAAVNETCRLESLCKTVGSPIVASAAFHALLPPRTSAISSRSASMRSAACPSRSACSASGPRGRPTARSRALPRPDPGPTTSNRTRRG